MTPDGGGETRPHPPGPVSCATSNKPVYGKMAGMEPEPPVKPEATVDNVRRYIDTGDMSDDEIQEIIDIADADPYAPNTWDQVKFLYGADRPARTGPIKPLGQNPRR